MWGAENSVKAMESGFAVAFLRLLNGQAGDRARKKSTTAGGRFLLCEKLATTRNIFIRQDGSYLYYGTHSALGLHGHLEWCIQGFNLTSGRRVTGRPLQIVDFFGSDLGSNVCFGMHSGSFYAVSNQASLEDEEVDWTSYYYCIQFPVDDDKPNLKPRKLWRRQHREGPINDSWTELSLHKDERTDKLLIVECRREHLGGGSASVRTCYIQPFSPSGDGEASRDFDYPENDPLTKTLDDGSKPNYEPPKKRIRRYCHPEYDLGRLDMGRESSQEFILAMTRYRAYNLSTSSFIDLVVDPIKRPGFARPYDRIRLRIASRVQKSPLTDDLDKPGHFLLSPKEVDENGVQIEHSEEDFYPTEVQDLWPPNDAPPALFDILCPRGRVGQLDAMADASAIVYMTGPSPATANGERAIVLISFDPAWKHDGLKGIDLGSTRSNALDIIDSDGSKRLVLEPLFHVTSNLMIPGSPDPSRRGICQSTADICSPIDDRRFEDLAEFRTPFPVIIKQAYPQHIHRPDDSARCLVEPMGNLSHPTITSAADSALGGPIQRVRPTNISRLLNWAMPPNSHANSIPRMPRAETDRASNIPGY